MDATPEDSASGGLWSFWTPLNVGLLIVCGYLVYKIMGLRRPAQAAQSKPMPKMRRRDLTVQELRHYDGRNVNTDEPDRILVAVNGTIFDMSNSGRRQYGPGGAYAMFAGRDASRALAVFSLDAEQFRDEYDDLADLTASQLEVVREWERQFREKYDVVGRLLKLGEQPSVYTDDEKDLDRSNDSMKQDKFS